MLLDLFEDSPTNWTFPAKQRFRILSRCLKGQCHEIFCFCFFHESVSSPTQNIALGAKTRGVKVHHRCQRHRWQIFPSVSLVLLIPVANLPPGSTIPAANLPPVSRPPVANCHWYQRHRLQICHRCKRQR